MQRTGMVIEIGEARSELSTGHVILDQSVHVDDSSGITELYAGDENEEERDHRVHGLKHLALPLAHSRSTLWSLGSGIGGAREKPEIESARAM